MGDSDDDRISKVGTRWPTRSEVHCTLGDRMKSAGHFILTRFLHEHKSLVL